MTSTNTDRCGYEWPEDCERVDIQHEQPIQQSCCIRDAVDDADRCVWHVDPVDSDEKTAEVLRGETVPDEIAKQISGPTELLDGTLLQSVHLPPGTDILANTSLRGADLSDAHLRDTDLSGAILQDADLSYARLRYATLRNADLSGATLYSTNLSFAHLRNADLSYADLPDADLSYADLSDAHLRNADLSAADLSPAVLSRANLSGVHLLNADLSGADLSDADLSGAIFQDADLSGASLRSANLDHAGLNRTLLENVKIDEGLTAKPPSLWELEADAKTESGLFGWWGIRRLRGVLRWRSDPTKLEKAERQYRRLERLYRESDLSQDPALKIQEKHARRKRALAAGQLGQWLRKAFVRWVLGYGLKIGPILGIMLAVIAVCTLLYPAAGIEASSVGTSAGESAVVTYETVPPSASMDTVRTLAQSLYFSTITFSTLGYANVAPVGWARAVATVESLVGALSIAYLVSVLSRRAIR